MTPSERSIYAQSMFKQYPEHFPEHRRSAILRGVVEFGMTPFEAKLAGGAFAYMVIADPARWPEHSDPMNVMWAQSVSPDNSEIWMTFKNMTQFPGQADRMFRVYFEQSKAMKIEIVEERTSCGK
jgi:hypothetical protein